MRLSFRSAVAGVATLAIAGVMAAAGASSASAATAPYEPDPDAYGTITFYDAAGNVVTSGDATDPQSIKYAVASTTPTGTANSIAGLFFYAPQPGQPTGLYPGTQLNGNTVYPLPGAPAPVGTSPNPATQTTPTSKTLAVAASQFTANTGALQNVWQIRLKSSQTALYASTSITIDPATNHWQQIFPVVPVTVETSTTLATSPASPATASAATGTASVTLNATVAAASGTTVPSGTVEFFNGTTSLGAPVAVDATGKLSKTVAEPVGSYSFSAKFVSASRNAFFNSASAAQPYSVQAAPAAATSVALTGPATVNVGSPATYTATVSPSTAPGTIEFFDGATSLGAPQAAPTASVTTTLAAGNHTITAKFVSSSPAQFADSTSAPITTSVLAGACTDPASQCTDPGSFTATVPVGTLSISTPFHASNPFKLGTLVLNANGTELSSGAKSFAGQDSTGKGITITDTRSGNLPWTANLQSSNFTSGTNSIAAKNLGFTGVTPNYLPGNALQAGSVQVFQNPAFSVSSPTNAGLAAASKFASAANGAGSVNVNGDFTLNAPTSTPAGIYTGTVTFTIA